jgi:long-subunit acyl-CoA synthetase (AMP-forming)
MRAIDAVHPIRPQGRVISWLPLAHLADRAVAHYLSLLSGATVTCVTDPRAAVAALPQVRPTVFLAVPRVWEKLRAALEPALAADPGLRTQVATNLGLDTADLVLSGAAPIAPEVLEFFAGVGVEIYEAWGMTETGAAATLASPGEHRVGTVGKPLPGVEVRLAGDGELLVRGPIVMRGYRNDPERTAEVLKDGWMHTGDIGQIDTDGYVKIVDRKKELIINAAGKNMSPSNIENTIKAACPLIGSVIAIGDRRPYNTALVTLDRDAAGGRSIDDPGVQAAIADGIERANERLSRVEQIKKHTLIDADWEPGGDELTPTMKLKRKPITAKYAVQIEAMYG